MAAKTIPFDLYVANNKHHKSKEFLKDKQDAEEAMQLGTKKFIIPFILRGNSSATSKWRQLVKLYKDFAFVTSADTDILAHYCLCFSELKELLAAKKEMVKVLTKAGKKKHEILDGLIKNKINYSIDKKREALSKFGEKLFLDPTSRIKAVTQPKPKKADPLGDAGFNEV